MREELKDNVEDTAAATLEALVSLVPGIGGVLAVFTNRALGSSFERRTVRILAELRDDLSRLEASGYVAFDDRLTESDRFQASVHRTIRHLLEADSGDKRTLLRNALLNRIIGVRDSGRFDEALDRIQPKDMMLLKLFDEKFTIRGLGRRTSGLSNPHDRRAERLHRIVTLGLVADVTPPGSQHADGNPQGPPLSFQSGQQTVHRLTRLGSDFIGYVSNPITDDGPDQAAGASNTGGTGGPSI
ncbi:hypothetical protein [Curtobacterium sp. MCLR17_054]|uniref:hypothetical protein n=1 Tax=Curtobacterium sp. MCLR17_054 TaxID=2175632 RepID=UPI0011B35C12|nr:hypothetical protein [Curtobacterium sp. MCLR17_054]WIE68572.1 hypothetical protein DEJ08_001025 [Curtobacterium sp. MCLR17_054]